MKFYLIDNYEEKNLIGEKVFIEKGSILSTDNNDEYICYQDVPLCTIDSNVARTRFIWADDGDYLRRLYLEKEIVLDPRIRTWEVKVPIYDERGKISRYEYLEITGRFSPVEVKYIKKNFPSLIEKNESGIIFNSYFYHGSKIEDLEKLAYYLENHM